MPAVGIEDRAVGALLGLAVGDALGTTLEFRERDSCPPLTDIVGGGPFDLLPGEWTDDTAMALALAHSLADRGGLDPGDCMARFVAWFRSGDYSCTGSCFDIGITTRQALLRYESDGNPFAGAAEPETAGNGSLMRLAPVAIWGARRSDAELVATARDQSRLTHAAEACLAACEAYATLVARAIRGASREAVLAAAVPDGADPAVAEVLAGTWRRKARAQVASSGYVVHSLEAALWCVGESGNFADAVLLAANLGDDADTVAAITGQLAGALYGASGIPAAWRERVAWGERIEEVAMRLIAE